MRMAERRPDRLCLVRRFTSDFHCCLKCFASVTDLDQVNPRFALSTRRGLASVRSRAEAATRGDGKRMSLHLGAVHIMQASKPRP
jgi:hypothetical protein